MRNLPDGVTGNEFELAGPDSEYDDVLECPDCGGVQDTVVYVFRGSYWWSCYVCDVQHDFEVEDTRDYEAEYKARLGY